MSALIPSNWPSARHFTEALQYPAVSFTNPYLRNTLPAVDKLGMPLVTSGQFAYVYKLNRSDGGSWAIRCFRSFLADRHQRYTAFDTHFRENFLDALPRFAYEQEGLLLNGRRFPILVMEWLVAPTLDTYVGQVLDKPNVLQHLADEWVRLMAELREAGVAHGDLQHGNILVQNGGFRLVDLDGMYVPALKGWRACEVGHQHFQHPGRSESWFHEGLDNFAALSIYLSLLALIERPSLWREHHDENLLFTKADFQKPDASQLFGRVRELNDETRRLADLLVAACRQTAPPVPPLDELVAVKEETNLPAWMNAPEGTEIVTRTREAVRMPAPLRPTPRPWYAGAENMPLEGTYLPATVAPAGQSVPVVNAGGAQTLFGGAQQLDPQDVWSNTLFYAGQGAKAVFSKIGAFWIIFLFSSIWIRLITGFWAMFGVDALAAFFLTFLLGAFGFLVYGFLCALELANNAPALAGLSSGVVPSQPVFQQTAGPAAALPPAQPSNIPWYRQNTTAAQVPATPLPPGTRRAPDWAISARPQPPPPTSAQAAIVAHYPFYHNPDCAEAASLAVTDLVLFDTTDNARQAGYQSCPACKPFSWLAPQYPAATPANSLFTSPPPPLKPKQPAKTAQPVVANRDTGVYHRLDCEDAVIISQEDAVNFNSLPAAERAGFHRCQICKPAAQNMPLTTPPQPVVGNQETSIYHRPDCEWASGVKPSQIKKFNSGSEAEAKGFHRCVTCHPGLVVTPDAVIGDRENLIYHLTSCNLLDLVEVRFQVNFAAAEKAVQANYQPCLSCHP